MNYTRLVITSIAATVVYFILGGLVFALTPLRNEFRAYPALYRPMEAMQPLMPLGLLSMFVGIVIVVSLFALTPQRGAQAGIRFGGLAGIFVVCEFVIHNYVNLNIGLRLTVFQAVAFLFQWTIVGLVIGLLYKT
ncbi:MAG TPA: hypothetical protein VKD91_13155 [Pyrinomonadaceae bacterium]|nr:hypothetical protein [Pyrinomonadaceae bacterium]